MKKLSIAIAVYNEETNLDRCLKSVKDISDEIIVVDGGSTDKTLEIAEKYHAFIIKTDNPPVFHINKQKAVAACSGEWILQIDADEEVSPLLAQEIKETISTNDKKREYIINNQKKELFERHQRLVEQRDQITFQNEGPVVAYFLPRRNFFLGKAMTYAGMYPDGVIRLFERGKAIVPSKSVHEQLAIDGRVGWLEHDLYHYSNPTLKKYFSGADKYTNLLAREIAKDKRNEFSKFVSFSIVKPCTAFLSLLFRHKGILDGWHGFLFSFFSACHFPVAYYKYVAKKN